MIGDLPRIVTEGFPIPENRIHKNNFCEITFLVEKFKSSCSCLTISPSELILV